MILFARPLVSYGAYPTGANWHDILDSASLRIGIVFQAPGNDTLTGIRVTGAGVAGTAANIGQLEVFAAGADLHPTGAALATQTFTPASQNPYTVTIASPPAVTAGTLYVATFRNQDPAPATNSYGLAWHVSHTLGGSIRIWSVNAGATWTFPGAGLASTHAYPVYGTLGVFGEAVGRPGGGTDSAVHLFNVAGSRVARHAGRFRFPAAFRVYAAVFGVIRFGNPTFALRAEIITGGAVVATSVNTLSALVAGPRLFHFGDGVVLAANTDYEVALTPVDATAGDSGNHVRGENLSAFSGFTAAGSVWRASVGSTGTAISWSATPPTAVEIRGEWEQVAVATTRPLNFSGGFTL